MNIKNIIVGCVRFSKRKLLPLNLFRIIGERYVNRINRNEFLHPPFNLFNERPVEYRFVFEQIAELYPKKILDVGTGVTALPHLMANCGCNVTAIDNIKDYWRKKMFNRHFYLINDDITDTKIKNSFNLITCISTLEHIEKYEQAVNNMFSLLKTGGHLILTFPYSENKFIDNVYMLPGSCVGKTLSFKTHSFSRNELGCWTKKNNAVIVKQEYWQFFSGDFWTVGQRLAIPKLVAKSEPHQISCVIFKKQKT